MKKHEFREAVADLCHRQWAGWKDYMVTNGRMNVGGTFTIDKDSFEKWDRQRETDYENLSLREKNSDRKEADKFIELFKEKPND